MCPLLLFLSYTPNILKTFFSIVEFVFRSSTRDKICVLNNTAYWIKNNNKANGNSYSLKSVKQAVSYFLDNCFFKVAFQIFFQVLGLLSRSDPDLFFAKLLLFLQESESKGKTKKLDHHCGIRTINISLLVIVENIQY